MRNSIYTIDELDVSNKWKRRFHLLKQMGADELSYFMVLRKANEGLSFKERMSSMMNFYACFGGCFYYFYKNMHLKGGGLFSFSLLWVTVLGLIEFFSGMPFPNTVYWSFSAALCGQWANYDLYRKTFHDERLWSWVPTKRRNQSSVLWLFALCVTVWGGSVYYMLTHTYVTYAAESDPKALNVSCGAFLVLVTQEEMDTYGRNKICMLVD